jgi:CDP-diacylglycerol--glycerol-3-phosphate 3-phosphatidyltransferase
MIAQVIAVSLFLLSMHWNELTPWAMGWMWCVVFFALLSAVGYFRKFWRKVDDRIKRRRRRELLTLEKTARKRQAAL